MTADENRKFTGVAEALDSQVASEVRDTMVDVPKVNPCTTLETELIKRLSASQEQKTRLMLEMKEIGDKKPTQF